MIQQSDYLIERSSRCQLLYKPELLKSPMASFLSREILQQASSSEQISSGGRGQAWFVELEGLSAVLRTYLRGGLIAIFNQQTYLGLSAESSRGFKEWRLLQWMFNSGLPVPRPVAASVCRWPCSFSPLYRAHILIERIPNAQTLDQLLIKQSCNDELWKSIGQCIRRFHNAGIYHADLNANNILLDDKQSVFLIDFDKGEVRENQQDNAQWKLDNLQRLKRSLLKQQSLHSSYAYSGHQWRQLMSGYDGVLVVS